MRRLYFFDWNLDFGDIGFVIAADRLRDIEKEFPRRSRLTIPVGIDPVQQGLVGLADPVKGPVMNDTGGGGAR